MSQVIDQIVLGVVANGFSSVLARIFRAAEGTPAAVEEAIASAATKYLAESGLSGAEIDSQLLKEFLLSPETRLIVEQLFASGLDHDLRTTDQIRKEFVALWRWTGGGVDSENRVAEVFDILAATADVALELAIQKGVLSAAEARNASRHREVMSSLENVVRVASMVSSPTAVSPEELSNYATIYLRQVRHREGPITPPNFDSARKVPLEALYVDPHIVELARSGASHEPVEVADGLPHRAVVLGNPGGGKSTLAKKVVVDTTDWHSPAGSRAPFLVILRDFASFKAAQHGSIASYIEAISSSHYQVAAPPGGVEHLLTTGQALVVFDGLDELLDTARRQEISADIESFASRFPATPVLITSRIVGYEQAPLDKKVWRTFRLDDFGEKKVQEYVGKWFALDSSLTRAEHESHVRDFMDGSEGVPDLRSNPLMLGLMCNLYRGVGYIPRNRPDVYEQCSVMLFERWDSQRHITPQLGFERHLRPTMRFLAYWMYTHVGLQEGVAEKKLVEEAAGYLEGRRFEDPEEALVEARKFIRFCRGRAWVFTDTGADRKGETLYQFTHRTFLEYFAAEYLASTHVTPESLLAFLRPKISNEEWDEVAQLALQIKDKHVAGTADKCLALLTPNSPAEIDAQGARRLAFAARALSFLVPRPKTSRVIAERVVDSILKAAEDEATYGLGITRSGKAPADAIIELRDAASDNVQAVVEGLIKRLTEAIMGDSVPVSAAELALNIRQLTGASPLWPEVSTSVVESCGTRLAELSREFSGPAVDAAVAGSISVDELIERYGVALVFESPPLRTIGMRRRPSISQWVVASCLGTRPFHWLDGAEEHARTELSAIAGALLAQQPPWFEVDRAYIGLGWPLVPERRSMRPSFNVDLWNRDERFALFMLMASIVEEARLSDQLRPSGTPREVPAILDAVREGADWIEPGGKLILGWAAGEEQGQTIDELELAPYQASLLSAWVDGRIRLAHRGGADSSGAA